jgi:N-acetyl-anhydromuramyl-L-alanine amidase AmpD
VSLQDDNRKPPPLPPLPPPAIVAVPGPLRINARPAAINNYSRIRRVPLDIVLHCTDGCEGTNKDTDVAAMFASPLEKPRSSHYVVDADSVTRCVQDQQIAWHCGRTGNLIGIGIELCGSAKQTREQWLDVMSLATLQIAARLCADLCKTHGIPPTLVTDQGLLRKVSGITTHDYVSRAWNETTHSDPGPGFPINDFVRAVAVAMR